MRNFIIIIILTTTIICCAKKDSCDKIKNRVFQVNFPSSFPFGRNESLNEFDVEIGNILINYDNPNQVICLPKEQMIDTIFWKTKSDKGFYYVLAKFKNGENYSVAYNTCESMIQIHPEVDTDLVMQFRFKVVNLNKGDTLKCSALHSDSTFYISDSVRTDWCRATSSAMCNNSFKYFYISKAFGIRKVCEENDSLICRLQADTTIDLKDIVFQQLHNEKLDIFYDYKSDKLSISLE